MSNDKLKFVVDEIDNDMARLEGASGQQIVVPKSALPTGAKEGDHLTGRFEADPTSTAEAQQGVRDTLNKVFSGDDGGDVSI